MAEEGKAAKRLGEMDLEVSLYIIVRVSERDGGTQRLKKKKRGEERERR